MFPGVSAKPPPNAALVLLDNPAACDLASVKDPKLAAFPNVDGTT